MFEVVGFFFFLAHRELPVTILWLLMMSLLCQVLLNQRSRMTVLLSHVLLPAAIVRPSHYPSFAKFVSLSSLLPRSHLQSFLRHPAWFTKELSFGPSLPHHINCSQPWRCHQYLGWRTIPWSLRFFTSWCWGHPTNNTLQRPHRASETTSAHLPI